MSDHGTNPNRGGAGSYWAGAVCLVVMMATVVVLGTLEASLAVRVAVLVPTAALAFTFFEFRSPAMREGDRTPRDGAWFMRRSARNLVLAVSVTMAFAAPGLAGLDPDVTGKVRAGVLMAVILAIIVLIWRRPDR